MKQVLTLLVLLFGFLAAAQQAQSKADRLYDRRNYREAIRAYEEEARKGPLATSQLINFAHSHFRTDSPARSAELYFQAFERDSTLPAFHLDRMLSGLIRGGKNDLAWSLFRSQHQLPAAFIKTAEFNKNLLEGNDTERKQWEVFALEVNSSSMDLSPAFYGELLLFSTTRVDPGNKGASGYLDLYVGKLVSGGQVLQAKPFTQVPVNPFHEGTPYWSESLNRLFYICSNFTDGKLQYGNEGRNSLAIVMTDFNELDYLLRDLNTSFYYPFYDESSKKLYFAAELDDSLGGTDIYFVYTNNGRIMSAPVNLGPAINSPGNEIAPYLYQGTLYFSSDVFYGLGGMDLYKTELQPDGSFSIPVNLGPGINTSYDDFAMIIREETGGGFLSYFSSNRPGGSGSDDLYGMRLDTKPGLQTLVVQGTVSGLGNNRGLAGAEVRLLSSNGEILEETRTLPGGDFRMEIPSRDAVTLEATKEGHSVFSSTYRDSSLVGLSGRTLNIGIMSIEDVVAERDGKQLIKMNKFYFDRGSTELSPEITRELDKVVEAASRFPELRFRIIAHTDSRGGRDTNQRLSQERAEAIKSYLLQQGVGRDAVQAVEGRGEAELTNHCEDGVYCLEMLHKQNERYLVEVVNYEAFNSQ